MRWHLGGDWPVGQYCIPIGTIVSAGVRDGEITEAPHWNGVRLPLLIPLNAAALDDDAAMMMLRWYPDYQWHRLRFGPDIDRDAIITKASGLTRKREWSLVHQ